MFLEKNLMWAVFTKITLCDFDFEYCWIWNLFMWNNFFFYFDNIRRPICESHVYNRLVRKSKYDWSRNMIESRNIIELLNIKKLMWLETKLLCENSFEIKLADLDKTNQLIIIVRANEKWE